MLRLLRLVVMLRFDKLLRTGLSSHPFIDYFKSLEKAEAVRRIFGSETETVLRNLRVEFTPIGGYMGVNSMNGHIIINPRYLNQGNKTDIYLDLIHELVHVRQFMEGKELFDSNYNYVDRPTEIEAYRHAVEEARRLGLNDQRICEYLRTEWISADDLKRLARSLGVKY